MRMVSFRLNRECREITVNPAKVLYICHYDHGASTIHFGKDCQVRVQGDVADVTSKVDAALSDHGFEAPTAPDHPPDSLRQAKSN